MPAPATGSTPGRPRRVQTVRVTGASLFGTRAELVTVEARFDRRDRERTEVVLTGLPDAVIRESRGRIVCALEANGLHLVHGRLFLNLVPAARRKSGESLDLPLVLGACAASGHVPARLLGDTLFLGEVGIDGRLHAVPGGFAAARAARAAGIERVVAPDATAREAACLPGVRAHAVPDLAATLAWIHGAGPTEPLGPPEPAARRTSPARLDDVRGQPTAKRALAIAAAGGHGLLLIGPPGAGKSMLAERLRELLPPPTTDERIAITEVLSATGRWPGGLADERPLRAPHHTVSHVGLVGGGSPPIAGEITLAHAGVLFLDELPEFRRESLEALRQPLEAGRVTISRAGRQADLPARFQLVCAMNPCPCGHHGSPRGVCRCPPSAIERYRRRLSGPLLDRIDLRVELCPPSVDELIGSRSRPATAVGDAWGDRRGIELARAVERARESMLARQEQANARLGGAELDEVAPLDEATRELLRTAADRKRLSARAVQSIRRVACTLADLEGAERPSARHHAEAIGLRARV